MCVRDGAQAGGAARRDVESYDSITGYGVRAKVAGHGVLVGADRLMTREELSIEALADTERRLAEQGRTALFAAVDGKVAAVIGVADPVKPASAAAIDALHGLGPDSYTHLRAHEKGRNTGCPLLLAKKQKQNT